ncbi:MATE family efflux transporter [Paenibacillus eucommiae]|uniref:Probable multidrug resistance protein NorM n=1 Tax=Paenibacillus eucommiae TaxID=1355755 RepID=A0ABS4J0G5_9BACL|nr:MATE family efflux transporter [Paenibacillus eucommiae]MBP1993334.1 putative MATE family efflux protein [Paenibacillus eucommiae]
MFKHWKPIIKLAFPSLIAFSTQTVTATIGLIMLGHLGALTIAIVGVSNIIMYNAFAIFSGIGHTVNYLIAQNFGANDMKKGIERTYIALYLSAAFGIFLLCLGTFGAEWIIRLVSPELVEGGSFYLQLRFYAMACGTVTFVFQGFLRGVSRTRTTMVLSLANGVTMIFFTYALTFGNLGFPEMGLTGAGTAVLLGEAVALLGALYVYFFSLNKVFQTRSKVKFNRNEGKLILVESGKLGMQEFSMSVSMLIFTIFVARLGTSALAANEVALNVMSFGFMPAFAFGATATILVGQRVGQGDPMQAKRAGVDTAIIGTLCLILLGTIELFAAEPIARMFTNDPEVYKLAAHLIMVSAYLQIFDGLLNFYAGGLRGIGDTTFLLRASFVLCWFLFVPLAYLMIFVFEFGSMGAWISFYTFLVFFGLTVMYRFHKTDWISVRLKNASHE